MTFKEYRKGCSNRARFILSIIEGKNLKKESYDYEDFEDDVEYKLDDYEVTKVEVVHAYEKHFLTIKEV